MKKVFALMMASVIALSTPMAEVHAESNGEGNLEDELIITDDTFQSGELGEDDLEQEDLINTSLWIPKEHSSLAKSVMDKFDGKSFRNDKALIQRCLVFAAENADEKPLHNSKELIQLHGHNNYILHLNALWLYARKICVRKQKDETCKLQILNELPVKNPIERKDLETLLSTVPKIYELYKNKSGHKPSNSEKQYLVLGLALHLIGDIYAHRTIVTTEAIKNELNNTHRLKRSDFNDYDDFYEKVRKGEIRCSKIDEEMKGHPQNIFEDDPNFMPKRFEYSRKTARSFIGNYVKSGTSFSSGYIKRNASDKIVLQDFDKYL